MGLSLEPMTGRGDRPCGHGFSWASQVTTNFHTRISSTPYRMYGEASPPSVECKTTAAASREARGRWDHQPITCLPKSAHIPTPTKPNTNGHPYFTIGLPEMVQSQVSKEVAPRAIPTEPQDLQADVPTMRDKENRTS
jgi:hypothetical protein